MGKAFKAAYGLIRFNRITVVYVPSNIDLSLVPLTNLFKYLIDPGFSANNPVFTGNYPAVDLRVSRREASGPIPTAYVFSPAVLTSRLMTFFLGKGWCWFAVCDMGGSLMLGQKNRSTG